MELKIKKLEERVLELEALVIKKQIQILSLQCQTKPKYFEDDDDLSRVVNLSTRLVEKVKHDLDVHEMEPCPVELQPFAKDFIYKLDEIANLLETGSLKSTCWPKCRMYRNGFRLPEIIKEQEWRQKAEIMTKNLKMFKQYLCISYPIKIK